MNVTLSFPIWLPLALYLAVGLVVLIGMSVALVRDYRKSSTTKGESLTVRESVAEMLDDAGRNGLVRLVLGCVLLWPLLGSPRTVRRIIDTVTADPAVTR